LTREASRPIAVLAMDPAAQVYWNRSAESATFSHPVKVEWLAGLGSDERLLDYGCGYGRTLAVLHGLGWRNAVGVDMAEAMIARGRREHPTLDLRVARPGPLPFADGDFDAALLFAVLTTIPRDADQLALAGELARLLRPRGLLYVSDYPLQSDERNLRRYQASAARHGVYGVWDREDGGVFRHHEAAWLHRLFADFDWLKDESIQTITMGGSPSTALQILLRRR
jgi:SAM-dependent methyltransferase